MLDYNIIKDCKIALLIWNTEKENDAHVYLGKVVPKDDGFYFVNEIKKWTVFLDSEKWERLKEVTEDMKEIFLNADFCITLYMTGLPDESKEGLNSTGMKWHE